MSFRPCVWLISLGSATAAGLLAIFYASYRRRRWAFLEQEESPCDIDSSYVGKSVALLPNELNVPNGQCSDLLEAMPDKKYKQDEHQAGIVEEAEADGCAEAVENSLNGGICSSGMDGIESTSKSTAIGFNDTTAEVANLLEETSVDAEFAASIQVVDSACTTISVNTSTRASPVTRHVTAKKKKKSTNKATPSTTPTLSQIVHNYESMSLCYDDDSFWLNGSAVDATDNSLSGSFSWADEVEKFEVVRRKLSTPIEQRRTLYNTTPGADEELRRVMASAASNRGIDILSPLRNTSSSKSYGSPMSDGRSQTSSASTGFRGSSLGSMAGTAYGFMSPVEEDDGLRQDLFGIEVPTMYEFEVRQDIVGLIIGQKGRTIKEIMDQSGAHIVIRSHWKGDKMKICTIEGTRGEINRCLRNIRRRFPPYRFPELSLEPLMPAPVPSSHTPLLESEIQLSLAYGKQTDVILSSLIHPGHFFLQQSRHPSFPALARLDQYMLAVYSAAGGSIPELPRPVERGIVCAAPVMGGWYRAQTICSYEDADEVVVRYCDYGGYSLLPASDLRQIRSDFMTLPFQACECYLAYVKPTNGEDGWSAEANALFQDVAYGKTLTVSVISYAPDGVPFVDLYVPGGEEDNDSDGSNVLVSEILVNCDLAEWIETAGPTLPPSPTSPPRREFDDERCASGEKEHLPVTGGTMA